MFTFDPNKIKKNQATVVAFLEFLVLYLPLRVLLGAVAAPDGYSEAVKKLLAERFFGSDQLFVKVQFLDRYFTFLRALGRMNPVLKTDYTEIKRVIYECYPAPDNFSPYIHEPVMIKIQMKNPALYFKKLFQIFVKFLLNYIYLVESDTSVKYCEQLLSYIFKNVLLNEIVNVQSHSLKETAFTAEFYQRIMDAFNELPLVDVIVLVEFSSDSSPI